MGKSITIDDIKSGEKLSDAWYKYKNKYYVIFKDDTWAEYDDDSMYKASQPTKQESARRIAAQEYFKQRVDAVKSSEEYKNIKANTRKDRKNHYANVFRQNKCRKHPSPF